MNIKRPLAAAALFLCAACFILAAFFPEALMGKSIREDAEGLEEGDEIFVTGKVYKIQEKTYSVYVYLKGSSASDGSGEYKSAKKVLILIPAEDFDSCGIKLGNKISVEGSFIEFNRARNNGNYDEEEYYNSLGIFLKVSAEDVSITDLSINLPAQLMYELKERILASFDLILGEDEAAVKGIFCAVICGDRSSLTEGTKSLYSENGIAHILAISGLHISIIGMGLFAFLKKITGPYAAGIVCSCVMLLYCIMCGLSVSALRAVIMFICHMGAYFTGKTYDLISALSLSAIVILLSEPFYILNSGFILSFGSILSIGVANKNLTAFLRPQRKITKALLSSCCVSVSLMPVIANLYFAVPLYGILLNLIVIPLMSLVLGSGLSGGLSGIISVHAGRLFTGLGYYTVWLINLCCYLAVLLPSGSIVTGHIPFIRTALFYAVLAVFIFLIRRACLKEEGAAEGEKKIPKAFERLKEHRRALRLFISLAVLLFLMLLVFAGKRRDGLEIIMFDVDQGDGILIITPEGTTIMIDSGSSTEDELWEYRLESALEYEKIKSIDYAVITHPDTDHISGILDLLSDTLTPIGIKTLLIPYVPDNENYEELVAAAQTAGVEVINIYAGMAIETASVSLTCLYPQQGAVFEDSNDYSAVLSLKYGEFTALFTGDIGQEAELLLIEEGVLLHDYDLLKVAHHGSKYSSCEEFLEYTSPTVAIISAGVDNSYGHPADETLERLLDVGAEIYVTADLGEIKITADKEGKMSVWTKF